MWRALLCLALAFSWPISLQAWGFDVHRFISDRAVDRLPERLRAFYESRRAFFVEHSVDPDLWRIAGFADEPPRHFLDLDAYGSYPFRELPRDMSDAIRKFGQSAVSRNGVLPWRTQEMYERLRQAFMQAGQRETEGNSIDLAFLSAAIAHYAADAHVPFHAVVNYDGQLTNQKGIHARFETLLFDRFHDRLTVSPSPIAAASEARDPVFEALKSGSLLVEPLLKADREAALEGSGYDSRYFEAFFGKAKPVLERRLAESIALVAALLTGAWEGAGQPALATQRSGGGKRAR